jgi:hypothetical protein
MSIEEQKGEVVNMANKDAIDEYKQARQKEEDRYRSKTINRDLAPVGNAPTLNKKPIPHTNDIPDVILQPPKARKRTENKW